jgi:hypothetical protein
MSSSPPDLVARVPQLTLFDATGVFAPELRRAEPPRGDGPSGDDLELGKAAEHLVCADLILSGYRAFLSDQGLPYDVLVDVAGRFVRIQVKATRGPKNPDPRTRASKGYFFHLRRAGKRGRRPYPADAFDIYALVAMDRRAIAYLTPADCRFQTIALRVPGLPYRQRCRRTREIADATFERALRGIFGEAERCDPLTE